MIVVVTHRDSLSAHRASESVLHCLHTQWDLAFGVRATLRERGVDREEKGERRNMSQLLRTAHPSLHVLRGLAFGVRATLRERGVDREEKGERRNMSQLLRIAHPSLHVLRGLAFGVRVKRFAVDCGC